MPYIERTSRGQRNKFDNNNKFIINKSSKKDIAPKLPPRDMDNKKPPFKLSESDHLNFNSNNNRLYYLGLNARLPENHHLHLQHHYQTKYYENFGVIINNNNNNSKSNQKKSSTSKVMVMMKHFSRSQLLKDINSNNKKNS